MASKLHRGALLTTAALLFIGCGDAGTSSAPTTTSPTTTLPATPATSSPTTTSSPTAPVVTTVAPAPVERVVVATFFKPRRCARRG
jgi:hypothetical protein